MKYIVITMKNVILTMSLVVTMGCMVYTETPPPRRVVYVDSTSIVIGNPPPVVVVEEYVWVPGCYVVRSGVHVWIDGHSEHRGYNRGYYHRR